MLRWGGPALPMEKTGPFTCNIQAMRTISQLIFLCLTGCLVFPLAAQTYSDDLRIEKKMQGMHELFELTADQSAQILDVFIATAEKLDANRPARSTDRNAFRQERRLIMQEMESGISTVLDDTQAARFRVMLEEYRQRRREGAGTAGAVAAPEKSAKTELTQDLAPVTEAGETGSGLLEQTLDFLYEDLLMPAIRKNN